MLRSRFECWISTPLPRGDQKGGDLARGSHQPAHHQAPLLQNLPPGKPVQLHPMRETRVSVYEEAPGFRLGPSGLTL